MSERPTNAELMAETMKVIRYGGSEGAVWSREAARARASEDEKEAQIKALAEVLADAAPFHGPCWCGPQRQVHSNPLCIRARAALRAVGRL